MGGGRGPGLHPEALDDLEVVRAAVEREVGERVKEDEIEPQRRPEPQLRRPRRAARRAHEMRRGAGGGERRRARRGAFGEVARPVPQPFPQPPGFLFVRLAPRARRAPSRPAQAPRRRAGGAGGRAGGVGKARGRHREAEGAVFLARRCRTKPRHVVASPHETCSRPAGCAEADGGWGEIERERERER